MLKKNNNTEANTFIVLITIYRHNQCIEFFGTCVTVFDFDICNKNTQQHFELLKRKCLKLRMEKIVVTDIPCFLMAHFLTILSFNTFELYPKIIHSTHIPYFQPL